MDIQSLRASAAKMREAANLLQGVDPKAPRIDQVVTNMKAAGEALASAAGQLEGAASEIGDILDEASDRFSPTPPAGTSSSHQFGR